jgi:hypothetical protein
MVRPKNSATVRVAVCILVALTAAMIFQSVPLNNLWLYVLIILVAPVAVIAALIVVLYAISLLCWVTAGILRLAGQIRLLGSYARR